MSCCERWGHCDDTLPPIRCRRAVESSRRGFRRCPYRTRGVRRNWVRRSRCSAASGVRRGSSRTHQSSRWGCRGGQRRLRCGRTRQSRGASRPTRACDKRPQRRVPRVRHARPSPRPKRASPTRVGPPRAWNLFERRAWRVIMRENGSRPHAPAARARAPWSRDRRDRTRARFACKKWSPRPGDLQRSAGFLLLRAPSTKAATHREGAVAKALRKSTSSSSFAAT